MKKKVIKKVISMALAAIMTFVPTQVFAVSNDIKGHWAESAITYWQDNGLISGYEDGTFKPDKSITRAEFAVMLNKALGFVDKGNVSFSDVKAGDWYYDAVAIAVEAGYCSGYEDGTFKPNETITRAEAAVMIALAKNLVKNETVITKFTDITNIPLWAKDYVGAVVNAGFMSGRPNGTFDATNTITRAEAVSSLDRAMSKTENVVEENKDVVVTKDDTVIEDQTIEGNLIIDKAVGDGEVYIKNTTVKGDIIVQGGGDNSIYLTNVITEGKISIEKKDVRLALEGKTTVNNIEVKAVCNIQGKNFEGIVGIIKVLTDLGTDEKVKLNVPAEEVSVEAKASVAINADVETVSVSEYAKDSKLEVSGSTTVGIVVANGKVAISGSGKVEKLEANISGITVSSSTNVTNTEVADGVDKPTSSNTSTGGSSSGSSGGSTGGSNSGGSSGGNTDDNTDNEDDIKIEIETGSNLQKELDKYKNANENENIILKLAEGKYIVPDNGELNYIGKGSLSIECIGEVTLVAEKTEDEESTTPTYIIETGSETGEGADDETIITALTINAPNLTFDKTLSVTGIIKGLDTLTFGENSGNRPISDIVTNVNAKVIMELSCDNLTVSGGVTGIEFEKFIYVNESIIINTENEEPISIGLRNQNTIGEIQANSEIIIKNIDESGYNNSGTKINKLIANKNIIIDAKDTEALLKIEIGTETTETIIVETNAPLRKVTVPKGAKTPTIIIKEDATIETFDIKENIILEGIGTVNNIVVTDSAVNSIKVSGITLDSVETTKDGTINIDGAEDVTVKKIESITAELDENYTPIISSGLSSSNIIITIKYQGMEETKQVNATYPNVELNYFEFDPFETEEQTVTVLYADIETELKVTLKQEISIDDIKLTVNANEELTDSIIVKLTGAASVDIEKIIVEKIMGYEDIENIEAKVAKGDTNDTFKVNLSGKSKFSYDVEFKVTIPKTAIIADPESSYVIPKEDLIVYIEVNIVDQEEEKLEEILEEIKTVIGSSIELKEGTEITEENTKEAINEKIKEIVSEIPEGYEIEIDKVTISTTTEGTICNIKIKGMSTSYNNFITVTNIKVTVANGEESNEATLESSVYDVTLPSDDNGVVIAKEE